MTTKNKGRNQATQEKNTTQDYTPIHSGIKAAIVHCAVWGVIPAGFATWLIKRGGMKHA